MPDYSISTHFLSKQNRDKLFRQHSFSKASLNNAFDILRDAAEKYNHEEVERNVNHLTEKMESDYCTAAICGHFSAGKSTLINQLIGKEILPSHPIPTSANIVHFQGGETTFFSYRDAETGDKKELKDSHWQQEWFTSAHKMEEVYITLPAVSFPKNLEIIDTPGIDSTESAHRLAAEKHLKQADKVYYVVDYQQVEAEENFSFLHQLNEMYIKPILLVNQIDKHDEDELSFSTFQEKIRRSLQKRRIEVTNVYFISAIQPSVRQKEWLQFTQELFHLTQSKHMIYQTTALGLYRELERLVEAVSVAFTPAKETVSIIQKYIYLSSLENECKSVADHLQHLPQWKHWIEKDMIQALDQVFANAKLTPYHTRNLIRDYLESKQASFRIKGMFARRKKIAREKQIREERLRHSLNENVRNYIDIHLRDTLKVILDQYHIHDRQIMKKILSIQHPIDRQMLKDAERKGALFSQEYTITYSRLIIAEIRKHYKTSLVELFPDIQKALQKEEDEERERLNRDIQLLENTRTEWKRWIKECKDVTRLFYEVLGHIRHSQQPLPNSSKAKDVFSVYDVQRDSLLSQEEINLSSFYDKVNHEKTKSLSSTKQNAQKTLEKAQLTLQKVTGLTGIKKSLAHRTERLRQKQYRIALFGAFSAGKSTLVNAFIGEKILPAAANPTTASVQYITAPDEEHPHKTVGITYKSEQDMLADMNDVIRPASITLHSMQDWEDLVKKKEQEEEEGKVDERKEERSIDPFRILQEEEIELLEQYYRSYHAHFSLLNKTKKLNSKEYMHTISNEEEAILIKDVTIYFDCSLTREGYVLTDTPGAGSIYRRHSEIAYKEIKKADAILFVSYYNHSFSKADQEFLIQLGRLKDYFSYDKMFFLVNAADLAGSKKEVSDVLSYVEKQLLRFGINSPRLFPVAGKIALENHEREHLERSGIEGFLEEFRRFADHSLEKMIIQEGIEEIKQAIHLLEDRLEASMMEGKQQQRIQEKHRKDLQHFIQFLENYDLETEMDFIKQEIEELFFYVKQRVFYRYYDVFKEIFRIVHFDQKEFTSQLHRYTNEILQFIFHDITQEARATIIRMEHFIQETWNNMQDYILEPLPSTLKKAYVRVELGNFPDIPVQDEIPVKSSDFPFLKDFKSYKEFFVEEKRTLFKETLEAALRPYGEQIIERYNDILQKSYVTFFQRGWKRCKKEYTSISQELISDYQMDSPSENTKHLTSSIKDLQDLIEKK